ncbi:GNAT family N-acetyltransferase [Amycolatopsis pigmentata]|uniref:GNAT family N-acetyltransferase n=1 Tax=Amycolatopsis pigmentata TaxID=450801 RepID=A0ABW5FVF0_9PSEU
MAGRVWRLHRFEAELGVPPERSGLGARLREELAEAVDSEADLVLVGLIDGTPVGLLHGQLPQGAWIERQAAVGPAGYVSRLFVEPATRRGSVGRSLVTAAHEALRYDWCRGRAIASGRA